MKYFFSITLSISILACRAGGDSLSTSHRTIFKHGFSPKEWIPTSLRDKPDFGRGRDNLSPLVEKMSDKKLFLLINDLFEDANMPPDLLSEVIMEAGKRNLRKISNQAFDVAASPFEGGKGDVAASFAQSSALHIEKIVPDYVDPAPCHHPVFLHPASNYYNEWDEDLSCLFKDEFSADATFTLELVNSEYRRFNMPSWGPLSSEFGWRHNRYHKGIDIQLRKGDTVTCAFDGMVRFAQKKGGYGNVVIVRHYNGLETVYAHLYKIKVKEGEVVAAGGLIGLAGSTGHSTGPHLHFEVRFMGAPVNPLYFISFEYGKLLFNTVVFKKNKSGLLAAFHPETEFHTVEKGETFAEIAAHYATTAAKIRELNKMPPKQYVRLRQGQILRVRTLDHSESASK